MSLPSHALFHRSLNPMPLAPPTPGSLFFHSGTYSAMKNFSPVDLSQTACYQHLRLLLDHPDAMPVFPPSAALSCCSAHLTSLVTPYATQVPMHLLLSKPGRLLTQTRCQFPDRSLLSPAALLTSRHLSLLTLLRYLHTCCSANQDVFSSRLAASFLTVPCSLLLLFSHHAPCYPFLYSGTYTPAAQQ